MRHAHASVAGRCYLSSVSLRSFLPLCLLVSLIAAGCGDDGGTDPPPWRIVHENLPQGLLSVWGTAEDDVWTVGSDAGDGPLVLHFDGEGWDRLETGARGDLWWVFGFAGGPIYLGGADGLILRYQDGAFEEMTTPGTGTVFGIWGGSPGDVWAVGGAPGGASGGFVWRLEGDAWVEASGVPAEIGESAAIWKVSGRSADDVWMVGTRGAALHWDGEALTRDDLPTGESLFTLHANAERFAAVGGFGTGQIFENDGSGWVRVDDEPIDPMVGVHLTADLGVAVGQNGAVAERTDDGWEPAFVDLAFHETLHAVWIDPSGGVWAVGGQVQVFPLQRGALLYKGPREVPGGIR